MEASASAAAALPAHFSLPSAERGRPLSGPGDGSFHGEVDFEFLREKSGNNPLCIHFHIHYCSKCPAVRLCVPKKLRVFFQPS